MPSRPCTRACARSSPLLPDQRKRQEVGLRLAARRARRATSVTSQLAAARCPLAVIDQRDALDRSPLAAYQRCARRTPAAPPARAARALFPPARSSTARRDRGRSSSSRRTAPAPAAPRGHALFVPAGHLGIAGEPEPVEAVAGQRQQVRRSPIGGKRRSAHHLDRHAPLVCARSSSTGCAERARLATHRTTSSPYSRR